MPAVHVPEHSRPLLEAFSSGRSFELDGYVFSVCGDYTRVSLHKVGK